ncbi:MAG: CbtB-domain containing protein [Micromonosporaceae bacterium]|nr:CbtB-domain containing protein [Micromonosporaceae bacterium]
MSVPIPTTTLAPVRVSALAWFAVAVAAALIYLLLQENGALLAGAADFMHEFTHDGRHALGVPCH